MDLICYENKVKFWQALTPTEHLFLHYGLCYPLTDNMYIEYDNGLKEEVTYELPKESVWDFSKVPESEYQKIYKALSNNDEVTLTQIQNHYLISGEIICCSDYQIISQFKTFFK